MKTQEKKLVDASNELSQKILDYREQAEELRLKIQELQAKVNPLQHFYTKALTFSLFIRTGRLCLCTDGS